MSGCENKNRILIEVATACTVISAVVQFRTVFTPACTVISAVVQFHTVVTPARTVTLSAHLTQATPLPVPVCVYHRFHCLNNEFDF